MTYKLTTLTCPDKRRRKIASGPMFALVVSLIFSTVPCQAEPAPAHAVASAHPLATAAGVEILREGGNAFDAAIAVSAALGVVEPYSSGFGGGGFWLVHRASDGKQVMIDGREAAPALAHERMYRDRQDNVIKDASLNGPLAAGIPGTARGIGPYCRTLRPAAVEQITGAGKTLRRTGFQGDLALPSADRLPGRDVAAISCRCRNFSAGRQTAAHRLPDPAGGAGRNH